MKPALLEPDQWLPGTQTNIYLSTARYSFQKNLPFFIFKIFCNWVPFIQHPGPIGVLLHYARVLSLKESNAVTNKKYTKI
jgi:hypothetical protein